MTAAGKTFSVLGADGYVGQALCSHLTQSGADVHAFGRDDADYIARPLGHAIYCIGLTADYALRPFDTVEAHVSLFARLLREARFDSMTYLSSTRLYDSGSDGCETAPLTLSPDNPRHLYDLSKALGESLCLTSGRKNVRAARLSVVYDEEVKAENFLHLLIRRAMAAPSLEIDSHPSIARDYVHLDDVCAALTAIALGGSRQIYNIAEGSNVANADLAAEIGRLTGCAIRLTGNLPENYRAAPAVDVSAIKNDFGLKPRPLLPALPGIVARYRAAAIS